LPLQSRDEKRGLTRSASLPMHGLSDLFNAIQDQQPVSGLTHGFYKYPARFAPSFAREAIRCFTEPGDLVYDPFMGGGTSVVEALALGRRAAGTDISSLAVFLAQAKTTILNRAQRRRIVDWSVKLPSRLNVHRSAFRPQEWIDIGYQRNINDQRTWRIRKLLEIGVAEINRLPSDGERIVARCAVLKAGQWALDCRQEIPTVSEFREHLTMLLAEVVAGADAFAHAVGESGADNRPVLLHRSAVGAEQESSLRELGPPALVLTSPPYPGVHVLYHRWQIMGRRETPAPFWIAGTLDGAGSSFYTFGDRKQKELRGYYHQAAQAFSSVAKLVSKRTVVAQMVAFSDPTWQLSTYLEMLETCGFQEKKFSEIANAADGRVWRSVPNRKWYADKQGQTSGSKEVTLFHTLRTSRHR
jgi:hypothetical protein